MICIAKHSSTKYTPLHMVYNRDPVKPFKLAENQRDSNPVTPILSRESMTINDHNVKMEHIYQSVLEKANMNIKNIWATQQTYHNICTFNNPFSEGDKS